MAQGRAVGAFLLPRWNPESPAWTQSPSQSPSLAPWLCALSSGGLCHLPLPFVASEKEALPKWEVLGGGRVDLKQLLTLCVFGQIIIANFV